MGQIRGRQLLFAAVAMLTAPLGLVFPPSLLPRVDWVVK